MLRKWICMLGAIILAAGASGQVKAAEQMGTVCIQPVWCGRAVAGGMVSVCPVGQKSEEGILLSDTLAQWQVQEPDLADTAWASWLAQKELGEKKIRRVEETGAYFEGLPAGIYLVQQEDTGEFVFEPFFLAVPEGVNWDVYRAPELISRGESPRTGDRPAPLVGAMGIGLSVAFLMVFVDEHRK